MSSFEIEIKGTSPIQVAEALVYLGDFPQGSNIYLFGDLNPNIADGVIILDPSKSLYSLPIFEVARILDPIWERWWGDGKMHNFKNKVTNRYDIDTYSDFLDPTPDDLEGRVRKLKHRDSLIGRITRAFDNPAGSGNTDWRATVDYLVLQEIIQGHSYFPRI